MSKEKQREIASKGGKSLSREIRKEIGKKGGMARARKFRENQVRQSYSGSYGTTATKGEG